MIKIIFFLKFYTECSNTLNKYNKVHFYYRYPMSLSEFTKKISG